MADGQYIISGPYAESNEPIESNEVAQPVQPLYEAQQTAAFSARLDTQQYTPENQPEAFTFIKEIEARLESYRETALAVEEMKHPSVKKDKFLRELINKESIIGGRRFQKHDPTHDLRFWHVNSGWFFAYSDGKKVTLNDSAIHYEVYNDHIKKSYQGSIVPFAPNELSIFSEATKLYEPDVTHELYPVDDTLQELKKEDLGLAA